MSQIPNYILSIIVTILLSVFISSGLTSYIFKLIIDAEVRRIIAPIVEELTKKECFDTFKESIDKRLENIENLIRDMINRYDKE